MKLHMEPRDTICVYCSVRDGVGALLTGLRKQQPDARITAVVPPDFVWPEDTPCPADHLVPADFGLGALLRPLQSYRFLAGLRRQRFDLVLTQFESIRLRVFAALVKPKEAISWLPTMELRPLSTSLVGTLLDMAQLRMRGYGLLCVALLHATVLPNPPKVRTRRSQKSK